MWTNKLVHDLMHIYIHYNLINFPLQLYNLKSSQVRYSIFFIFHQHFCILKLLTLR